MVISFVSGFIYLLLGLGYLALVATKINTFYEEIGLEADPATLYKAFIILFILAILNLAYGFYFRKRYPSKDGPLKGQVTQSSGLRILGILLALGPVALLMIWQIYSTTQAARTLGL